MTITAAADGSALGNPGPAGWGWYIDEERWARGGWPHGTNNMGELTAVLDLLQQTAHLDDDLHVICDSKYVINSITAWMPGWKAKGWRKKDGKPVLNVEIMQALDAAMQGRRVTFEWVKGHAGHELNEAADERARAMATAYQSGTAPEDMPAGPGFRDDAGRGIEAGDVEPDLFSAWASSEDLPAGHAGSTDSPDSGGTPEHLISDAASREATVLGRGNAPGGPGESLHPDLVCVDRRGATAAPESVLSIVEAAGCEPRELRVTALGAHAYHVSYRLEETSVVTRRSSVWVREDQHHDMGPWLLRYHQVTAEV